MERGRRQRACRMPASPPFLHRTALYPVSFSQAAHKTRHLPRFPLSGPVLPPRPLPQRHMTFSPRAHRNCGLCVCVQFFDRAVSTMETGPRSCSTLSVSSTPDKSQCRVVLAPFSLLVCSSILHDCPTAVYKATGETRPAT